jgi:pimeloyl-ACP methyl ester carboxylesterase
MLDLTERRQITLPDGRALGFAIYGATRGKPIFYFHGFPSSRIEARFAHGLALAHGAEIIAVDRPGYGFSDFLPGRTIGDWPRDVLQLADALEIDRFCVMAVSGGGPYALSCAHAIPDRVTAVGIVCGMGPMESRENSEGMMFLDRLGLFLGRKVPKMVWPLFALVAMGLWCIPGTVVDLIAAHVPQPDRQSLLRPDVRKLLADAFREAVLTGPAGPIRDILLYSRPWGFDLTEIRKEVHLWYGEKDIIVPPAMGRYLSQRIPGARLTLYPEEGHFSLIVCRLKEIVAAITQIASESITPPPRSVGVAIYPSSSLAPCPLL